MANAKERPATLTKTLLGLLGRLGCPAFFCLKGIYELLLERNL